MHLNIALAALPVLCTLSFPSAAEYPLAIENDLDAEYFMVEKGGTPEQPTLLLKRVRAGTTSYSLRLFDCAGQSYGNLGSGESVEAASESPPGDDLAPVDLVPAEEGTIAYQLWLHACAQ